MDSLITSRAKSSIMSDASSIVFVVSILSAAVQVTAWRIRTAPRLYAAARSREEGRRRGLLSEVARGLVVRAMAVVAVCFPCGYKVSCGLARGGLSDRQRCRQLCFLLFFFKSDTSKL